MKKLLWISNIAIMVSGIGAMGASESNQEFATDEAEVVTNPLSRPAPICTKSIPPRCWIMVNGESIEIKPFSTGPMKPLTAPPPAAK